MKIQSEIPKKYQDKVLKCTKTNENKNANTKCYIAQKTYIQSKSFLNVAIKALGMPPQEYFQPWPVNFSSVFNCPVLVMILPLSPPARVNF